MALDALKGYLEHAKINFRRLPTPEQIAEKFMWGGELHMKKNYEPKFRNFLEKHPELHLDPDAVIAAIDRANEYTGSYYDALFDDKSADTKMEYHNKIHTQITAVTASKMLLGVFTEIAASHEYGHYFQNPDGQKLMMRVFENAVTGFSMHEIDDWWIRGKDQTLLETVKKNFSQKLTYAGINTDDFNRLIKLDDYTKPKEQSVEEALKNQVPEPFYEQSSSVPSLYDKLGSDPIFREMLFDKISACIRTADFMQVYNTEYQKKITFYDPHHSCAVTTNFGSAVLAGEMLKFRPKALKNPEWNIPNTDPVQINWTRVGFDEPFYRDYVEKNINYAKEYLKIFDEIEYNNGERIREEIESAFHGKAHNFRALNYLKILLSRIRST